MGAAWLQKKAQAAADASARVDQAQAAPRQAPGTVTWTRKLAEWRAGKPFEYPPHLKTRFMYETAAYDGRAGTLYDERFIASSELQGIRAQDYAPFAAQLAASKDPHVTAFPNLTGDTLLVVPVPVAGKNYTTIKDFSDNAPRQQQAAFWKRAAQEIQKWSSTRGRVYVSTHGMGVSFFHLRLCGQPKYYETAEFR